MARKESYAHIEDAPSERSIGSIAAYAPKIFNRTSIMRLLALAVIALLAIPGIPARSARPSARRSGLRKEVIQEWAGPTSKDQVLPLDEWAKVFKVVDDMDAPLTKRRYYQYSHHYEFVPKKAKFEDLVKWQQRHLCPPLSLGTEIMGDADLPRQRDVPSAGDCQRSCTQTPGCVAFTWVRAEGDDHQTCFRRLSKRRYWSPEPRQKDGLVSGLPCSVTAHPVEEWPKQEMDYFRLPKPPERWDAVKQQLEEECAAAGESCKKSIGLVKDQNPEDKEAKMEYLCTSQALSCLSANMGKCGAFHDEVTEIQKQWQCEAMRCSAAGPNCSTAITFLEMDDSKLTDETRHKKSRFLCSKEAKQCLTDHKDICKTGFDIVSTAMEMGHCDKILCSEKGDDCRTAVTFLTKDPVSNVTVKESKEKWSYLCGDAAFHCLEKNLEQCTRYYNSLKLAFAEGHCNSARCAGEGPDCARMVDYLSQPDKFYYGEELRNKTKFLCGDKGIACIMEHGTCAEFQEAAKKEYKSSACGRSEHAQVEMPTLPPDGQVDARTDAERAYAKQKIKEKEEKEKKMLVTAKAQGENPKAKVVKSGADDKEGSASKDQRESAGEGSEGSEAGSNKKPAMTKEEKEKAGKKIFAALVVGVVAIGGFIYWRRRNSKSAAGSEGTSPTASPKPKKPPRPKLEMLHEMKEQAASAVTNTGSALAARLKAFTGLGMFKKDESKDEAKPEGGEEGKAAASTDEVKVEEPKPETAEPAAAPAPAPAPAAPKAGETGPEEPREY